ncbi:MAG: molybdopterin-guanine dinucleotide biosynthesis protein B [Hyphomicrobium sp.]
MVRPPVFVGIIGWKNSGKTTLVESLIPRLARRGLRVMTVKHTHHDLGPLNGSTDGERHMRAGALDTFVIAPHGWEISGCRQMGPPPTLAELSPHVASADVVIVEGFKDAPIPKIELRRTSAETQKPIAPLDTRVVAIAADHAAEAGDLPLFQLNDSDGLADFIADLAK